MSEWGLVAFYYDYEREKDRYEKRDEPEGLKRVKGLVSRAYKFPGVKWMSLHAYYGIQYFLRHIQFEPTDFSMPGCYFQSERDALNTSFDVFFDHGHIHPGVDIVKNVMDEWKKNEERYKDDEKLESDLFNCEGSYGWFYIRYIGGEFKYGYQYKGRLLDIRGALEAEAEEEQSEGSIEEAKDWKVYKEIVEFFNDNGTLFSSEDEFWNMEKLGADCVRDTMKEPQDDPFRGSYKDGAFTIKVPRKSTS